MTTRLTPMQPNVQRRSPVVDGFFVNKSKPIDFTCTEFDLSALPNGTQSSYSAMSQLSCFTHLQELVRY
jgi:hypothetical protein